MTPLCNYCGHPATHHHTTDFAGTHYTCNYHWNQLEPELQDQYLCIQTCKEPEDHKATNIRDTQRLLDKLQEEAAEVIQAVSKIRRFGPDAHHPDRTTSNLQELVTELEDWLALVAALEAQQLFDLTLSRQNIQDKLTALLQRR